MKVAILAGGLGSRLGEETAVRPKPMVEIGGKPILWHIMKQYSTYGMSEFIVCLGYKGYVIKEYFSNYLMHTADVTINLADNSVDIHESRSEPWRVTLVETGADTQTGGRLKAIRKHLNEAEAFCFTYGDGVSDVDIRALVDFHREHGKLATITAVAPPGRFGALEIDGDHVTNFSEKPAGDGGRINGGYFVASPAVLDLVDGPDSAWEGKPLQQLAAGGELMAYQHAGFWHPMDTLRDKNILEQLWASGAAPWKVW
jgi:glucose-1-phosphate cytidylyltransferase